MRRRETYDGRTQKDLRLKEVRYSFTGSPVSTRSEYVVIEVLGSWYKGFHKEFLVEPTLNVHVYKVEERFKWYD